MRALTFIVACLFLAIPCIAATYTVDNNGPSDFNSIQEAINFSSDYDTIEVQPGEYFEQINFHSKAITVTGIDPNNIDVVYATVIDGSLWEWEDVVTFNNGEDNTSVLAGLTVQNGYYGIYCFYSHPLIEKCVVRYSNIGIRGSSASPTIVECVIEENTGGGITHCDGEISKCKIINNSDYGLNACDGDIISCTIKYTGGSSLGALKNCDGNIIGCTISNNSRSGISACEALILNCIIAGNRYYGVVIPNGLVAPEIRNCTIEGNKLSGVYIGSPTIIANSIIIKNQNYGIINEYAIPYTLKYNNVWGNFQGHYQGVIGGTDIHENPLFAVGGYWDNDDNWNEGNHHLRSTAGMWDGTGWVFDDVNSPCIDAGDPCDSIGVEPNPNGGRINIGAYGGTAEASKSTSGIIEPVCTEYPHMDFNKDCKVDFQDFSEFAQNWLDCNLDPPDLCWQ